jgi:uncharacterized protein
MNLSYFRFYEELNDFLPEEKRKVSFPWEFHGRPSVKHAIEAMGVPHVEVDMILVNGQSVDFSYKVQPDDHISVYPVFESFDITPVTHLREKPLRDPKFIADIHLGRLVKYLRLCGFDTLFRNDLDDKEIIGIAEEGKRIILTRDRDMLKNKRVTRGYWVRSEKPVKQLQEVLGRLELKNAIQLFTRCLECNTKIIEVSKESVMGQLLPNTLKYYREFYKCPFCKRIYWKGSHFIKMEELIKSTML